MQKHPTYIILNWVFFFIIGLIFLYSYFLNLNTNQIKCIILSQTGRPCVSCGLSRCFSYMIHLDIDKATAFNKPGMLIFFFFLFQFVIRILIIAFNKFNLMSVTKTLVYCDVIQIVLLFMFSFYPYIKSILFH
jgi:hypothetical protein